VGYVCRNEQADAFKTLKAANLAIGDWQEISGGIPRSVFGGMGWADTVTKGH